MSWRRLCEPFDEPILPEEGADARECPLLDGPVTFESVAFTYPETTRPVLRDVSFTMEPGKVTALVGYTGAGKSSIAKLLGRTYDPDAGRILVNGIDLRDLHLDSFRPRLGIVPQDPFVFKGTVASNISYAKPGATDEDVESGDPRRRRVGSAHRCSPAASTTSSRKRATTSRRRSASSSRSHGRGSRNPTSSCSTSPRRCSTPEVEDIIVESIHALRCTTLMITHRESVAVKSDNIVVLEAGHVVDAGPEEQVARPGGPYDRLWRVQDDELAAEKDKELAAGSELT